MNVIIMQTIFDTCFESAQPEMDGAFAKSFGYRRKGRYADGSPITATLSSHPINFDEQGNIVETTRSHNFEVKATLICFDDIVMVPEAGDEWVEYADDGSAKIYEVVKGERSRCYDPIDGEENRLLVFAMATRRREPAR